MLAALPDDAPGVRLRHAEILYNRAHGDDRVQASRMFRDVAASSGDVTTRLHCLLRLGDIARGRAVRRTSGVRVVRDLAEAYTRPVQVLIATRNGRRLPEEAAATGRPTLVCSATSFASTA